MTTTSGTTTGGVRILRAPLNKAARSEILFDQRAREQGCSGTEQDGVAAT
ncbi:hypothetical protein [Burkholderia pyrrocinia]|nr:hypothetical protein [Burkholderia pyrrocinia]